MNVYVETDLTRSDPTLIYFLVYINENNWSNILMLTSKIETWIIFEYWYQTIVQKVDDETIKRTYLETCELSGSYISCIVQIIMIMVYPLQGRPQY